MRAGSVSDLPPCRAARDGGEADFFADFEDFFVAGLEDFFVAVFEDFFVAVFAAFLRAFFAGMRSIVAAQEPARTLATMLR